MGKFSKGISDAPPEDSSARVTKKDSPLWLLNLLSLGLQEAILLTTLREPTKNWRQSQDYTTWAILHPRPPMPEANLPLDFFFI